jgi:hypothetical protein
MKSGEKKIKGHAKLGEVERRGDDS